MKQHDQCGIFNWSSYLKKAIEAHKGLIPSNRGVLIGWDAGEANDYLIHSFVCTDWLSIVRWSTLQDGINSIALNREVKYSKLNDGPRLRALPQVLAAADQLQGMLITLAIHTGAMRKDIRHDKSKLAISLANFKHHWKSGALWNACIIADTVNLIFMNYLPNEGDLGVSLDEDDELWGNDAQREDFGRILTNWFQWTGVPAPVKEVRLSFDNYPLGKSLTAIPDLVSGATSDILDHLNGHTATVSKKALEIGRWMWSEKRTLKSTVVVVDSVVGEDGSPHTRCYFLGNPFQ